MSINNECNYSDDFIHRFWSKVNIRNEQDCWQWIGAIQSKGYGSFGIGGGKTALAHRVAFEITYGDIPSGMCVLHKCDDRRCVNPNHLTLGTIKENNQDMARKGRQARGERNGRSKLTVREVIRMRELHASGNISYKELADLFPVCANSIRSIIKGEYWKLPLAK